jgi:hypothetical protein
MEVIVQCQYEENMTLPAVHNTDGARRASRTTLQVSA